MESKKTIIQWQENKLDFSKGCLCMGVLNVTDDSFSDGGEFLDIQKAVDHGLSMADYGADIIDIGPESSRPGSIPIPAKQQIERAIPVIKSLAKKIQIPISIDTCNPEVAKAALDAGASIINDITALADTKMTKLAAQTKVPVILMHMQGTPQTMQKDPKYGNVVDEVLQFLLQRAEICQQNGIEKDKIFIDPGIGFGKTLEHNLQLLKNIDRFVSSGYKVLVGTSRKKFIGQLTSKDDPQQRIFGTAATVAYCAANGVSIVRVHDVAEMIDVIKVTNAITKNR